MAKKLLTKEQLLLENEELRKAKATLEEALLRKDYVFDASIVANSITDTDGILKEANAAFLRFWGYSNKKEIIGRPIIDFLQNEKEAIAIITALNTKGKWEGNYTGKKKDGSSFIAHGLATVILDANGVMVGYQSSVADITERTQPEEKEKKNRSNIDFLSKTAMQLVEFPQDSNIYDFVGEQIREFAGKETYIVVNSVDGETGFSTIHSVLGIGKLAKIITSKLGRHPVGMKFEVEDPNIHYQDGKLHVYQEGLYGLLLKTVPKSICKSIEKLASVNKIYVIDLAKQEHFFGSVIIFLKEKKTELKNKQLIETFIKQASIAILKKQAEETLRKNEKKLNLIINSSPVGICTVDMLGNFVTTNPAYEQMVGYSKEELVGLSFFDVTHPDDRPKNKNLFQKMFSLETTGFSMEKRYIRKDGEEINVSVHAIGIRDAEGNIRFGTAFVDDITDRKKAEEALEQSKKRLTEAQHIAKTGDFTWDVATGEISWSDGLFNLLKYDKTEKIDYAKVNKDIHHPDDLLEVTTWLNEGIASGQKKLLPKEYRLICKDGEVIYVRTTGIIKRHQKLTLLFATIQDITERKQAEKDLQMSELKYRNQANFLNVVIENSPFAMWVSDAKGILIRANKALRNILNVTDDMIIEKYNVFHDENIDAQGFMPVVESVFNDSKSARFIMFWTGTKAGHVDFSIANELWIDVSMFPIFDEAGKLVNVVCQYVDITERKQAEFTLKERLKEINCLYDMSKIIETPDISMDEIFQEVISMVPVGWQYPEITVCRIILNGIEYKEPGFKKTGWMQSSVVKVDGKNAGNIEIYYLKKMPDRDEGPFLNEERLVLDAVAERLGHVVERKHTEEELERYRTHLEELVKEGTAEILQINEQLKGEIEERKNGEDQIVNLNTELKQNITKLESSNKELNAFSYSVSHDLRVPLRAIDGFSKILLDSSSAVLDDTAKRHLNIIRDSTQDMGKLIDDLLSFSRIGKQEISISQINIEQMAKDVCAGLKAQNPGQNIIFRIESPPPALGDAAMIKIVLTNLLLNAIKFSSLRQEAVIEFGGSQKSGEVVYYVRDNGVGFDMKYVNKLFGVFQRLHGKNEFEGTGVGLALVQRIILRHGGRVWAEGIVNEGAVFNFSLPRKGEFV